MNAVWKVIAELPGLLGALIVMAMLTGPVQPWARLVVAAAGIGVAVWSQTRAGEELMARLAGGRPPTAGERATLEDPITRLCAQQLGPPAIEIMVVNRPGSGAVAFGRRTLLVTSDLINDCRRGQLGADEAAALMAAGVGFLRSGLDRWDGLIIALTVPWLPVRGLAHGVANVLRRVPLVGFAWRVRAVVIGIAVWQLAVDNGLPVLAVFLGAVGALSYVAPVAARKLSRSLFFIGDQFAADAGHGPALARFLRRFPTDDLAVERLHRLAPPVPRLSVVR